jgi:hypothetical protein
MKIARIENMKDFQEVLRLNKNPYLLQGFKVKIRIMIVNNWIIHKLKKSCFLKNLVIGRIQNKVNININMKILLISYKTYSIPLQLKRLKMNFFIENYKKKKEIK